MKTLLTPSLSIYLKGLVVLIIVAGGALLIIQKGDFVLYLNEFHSPVLDAFFKHWTDLGDGYMLIFLLVVSFFVSKYHSLLVALIAVFQGITTYVLKKVIFKGTPRPLSFFDEETLSGIQFVQGVDVHAMNSFPSGHTMAAFSFGAFLCLMFPKKAFGPIFLIVFTLVGISRVYLVQHFLMDITAGAILGVVVSIGAHWLLSGWLADQVKEKLQKPVFAIFRN